jgi:hypothetical protein
MAQAVQEQPTDQRRRIGVMAENPETGPFNLVAPHHGRLDMQGADGAVGVHHLGDSSVWMDHADSR